MASKDLELPLSQTTAVFLSSRSKARAIPYAGLKRTKKDNSTYKRFFYLTLQNILLVSSHTFHHHLRIVID